MWLRDALPRDITREDADTPIARVMLYGYSSSLSQRDNFQNLEDLATSFHTSLRSLVVEETYRPIVFIAHSLGGLIVKQVRQLTTSVYTIFSQRGRPSYPSPSRRMKRTRNCYERCTESSFSASHITAWIIVRLSLWSETA
jgi:hypothetical protein